MAHHGIVTSLCESKRKKGFAFACVSLLVKKILLLEVSCYYYFAKFQQRGFSDYSVNAKIGFIPIFGTPPFIKNIRPAGGFMLLLFRKVPTGHFRLHSNATFLFNTPLSDPKKKTKCWRFHATIISQSSSKLPLSSGIAVNARQVSFFIVAKKSPAAGGFMLLLFRKVPTVGEFPATQKKGFPAPSSS
jgi:hypothetical protein